VQYLGLEKEGNFRERQQQWLLESQSAPARHFAQYLVHRVIRFWAQQGAIYVFVALIFVYIHLMQKLDRQYGVSDDEDESSNPEDV
jgi:predicted lipid-binding transport protein (Tim44 family)